MFDHWGMTETGYGGGVECRTHKGYHQHEADLLVTRQRVGHPAIKQGTRRRMNEILSTMTGRLERGEHLVQAVILTQEGSTPRSAGSRMLLCAGDGGAVAIAAGTVGGGLVEAWVMAAAAQMLAGAQMLAVNQVPAGSVRRVEAFDLTGELAAGADMICGGRLRVFLERLGPGDLPLLRRLEDALDQGQRCLRLTPLPEPLPEPLAEISGPPALLLPEGQTFGAELPAELLRSVRLEGRDITAPVVLEHAGRRYALEPWAAASPLYIFGAGHVSRPTAQVAALAGFRVTVLDDRSEFANAARFSQAETRVLDTYDGCFASLPAAPGAFVVIVTRGHVHDAEVLAQALRTRAGYIGMIGSRRKRDAVYQRLRGQGFTEGDLARVHCPVGLAIEAETPEEIAVSIVAELIACRAAGRMGRMGCMIGAAV